MDKKTTINANDRPIRAVVFDMDGLLLDTERIYFEGYKRTRASFDLPPDDATFLEMIGRPQAEGQAVLQNGLQGIMKAAVFDARWAVEVRALTQGPLPVKPGVAAMVSHLQGTGLPYAIATSTKTPNAHKHLAQAGIGHHFPIIIGGDQVTRGKPAPDIYLRAAATLGIAPADCAAFEDSENGVRAALAAGMTTVQVPDIKHPSPDFAASGQHIAADLVAGAKLLGLM
ncbi:HAD family hydrolase [Yoonia sediminilitoris]|uniref:HAD superfamily hydrolase (TIGR01509 family) n=1 Tax=Yoonia sediminilitoris TaxID=1286148 RepID=A0A2T6KCQ5_9RHOB|nr:HAD family phosphatase [Yoonia sediminilitoris]PUB12743.1 HAD superfamily hydrolase (TIGR01509 family) [Yoonia sediminilitoris]RCW94222.1 HAD superfamily hydrolase (TIGR01509 family) [Yoonia sediminilitoris]